MNALTQAGRLLFAIALCGLGVEHFIYEDFIIARAPQWPESFPGKLVWAYGTGIIFIIIGVAVITNRKARPLLFLGSVLIFFWAVLRHIPVVASATFLFGEWTSAGKALTFAGGMLAIASTFPSIDGTRSSPFIQFINLQNEFLIAGRFCLGIFMIICGIQHFMFLSFVASLIPTWFPGDAIFWSKFAGVALIVGGIGLFIPKTAQWAAMLSGLMVFLWFWIVHLPRVFVSVSDNIAVFEALAIPGIAFVIAGALSKRRIPS